MIEILISIVSSLIVSCLFFWFFAFKDIQQIKQALKYGAYMTPTQCPTCHNKVEFVYEHTQSGYDKKLYAVHRCPSCNATIKTQITDWHFVSPE